MAKKNANALCEVFKPAQAGRVKVADLVLDPDNARKHDGKNLRAIKASLIEFGQVLPLVVEKGSKRVLGGNGTLRAMRALGWTECDVVEVDQHGPRASALSVALNRTAELADWDDDKLKAALRSQMLEFDLEALGWEEIELRRKLMPKMEIPGDEEEGDVERETGLRYRIVIDCADEGEQAELLTRLEGEGLTCQPLIS